MVDPLVQRFQQGYGYPVLPTEQQLEEQKRAREQSILQQAKAKRLQEQQAQAQQLRDKPVQTGHWASALGSLMNKAAGLRDVQQVQTDQGVNDRRLAQSMAAAQEAEAQKGIRDEQRLLAESLIGYSTAAKDRQGRENVARIGAASRERVAQMNAAQKKSGEMRVAIRPGEQGRQPDVLNYYTTWDESGKKVFWYPDQVGGQATPHSWLPGGFIEDTLGRRHGMKLEEIETRTAGRLQEIAKKAGFSMEELKQKSVQNLQEIDRKHLGDIAIQTLKGTQADGQIDKKHANKLIYMDSEQAQEVLLQDMKQTSAYQELVAEIDADKANLAYEWAAREKIEGWKIDSREKISDNNIKADMTSLMTTLNSKEQESLRGRMHDLKVMRERFQHDASMENLEHLNRVESEIQDRMHELKLQRLKSEASLEEAQLKAEGQGTLTRDQLNDNLVKLKDEAAPIEEVSRLYGHLRGLISDQVAAGGDVEGIGAGSVFEHDIINFILHQGSTGQLAASTGQGGTAATQNQSTDEMGTSGSTTDTTRVGQDTTVSRTTGNRANQRETERVTTGERDASNLGVKGQMGSGQEIEYSLYASELGDKLRAMSPQKQEVYAVFSRLVQKIAQAQSGLEVPQQEFIRIARSLGQSQYIDDKVIVKLLNDLGSSINMQVAQIKAGGIDEVVNEYIGRYEAASGNPSLLNSKYEPMEWGSQQKPSSLPQSEVKARELAQQRALQSPNATLATAVALQDPLAGTDAPEAPDIDLTNPQETARALVGGNKLDMGLDAVEGIGSFITGLPKGAQNWVRDKLKTDKQAVLESPLGDMYSMSEEAAARQWENEEARNDWLENRSGLVKTIDKLTRKQESDLREDFIQDVATVNMMAHLRDLERRLKEAGHYNPLLNKSLNATGENK